MQAHTIKEMLEKQGTSPALVCHNYCILPTAQITQVFLMLDQQEKQGQQIVAPKAGLVTGTPTYQPL